MNEEVLAGKPENATKLSYQFSLDIVGTAQSGLPSEEISRPWLHSADHSFDDNHKDERRNHLKLGPTYKVSHKSATVEGVFLIRPDQIPGIGQKVLVSEYKPSIFSDNIIF